ncbi:Hint domain-containing protein [Pseudooceanicola marinus]|uniref:Hint domain-containing protein n=1 Tax=Pseudooceanicola marinus TaxID=396013 RepID=UPI001CD2E182|nr:Hint domain-containing protein [Pseudooceanicola marinus]MCA1334431.1 Hint domain-containing protein [Pseudooceanicola marinus]
MTTYGGGSGKGDSINGTYRDDNLYGGCGDDTITGYQGNDDLYGKRGDDVLYGGDGDDDLHGDSGDDYLDGGTGHDDLDAEDGNDTLIGGDGNDKLDADSGDDLVYAGSGNDTVYGDDGHDEIYGGDGDDKLIGDSGDDTIYAGYGRDTIEGDKGDDELHGEGGEDLIEGDDGNDTIFGGESRDTIYGGDGNDFIDGGDGEDLIKAGKGDDTVYGGQGQDTIFGNSGDDFLEAGDTAWNRSTDTLYGGQGNDTLRSNGNQDKLYGGSGDDLFTAIADEGNLNNLYVYGGEDPGDTDWDVLDLSEFKERYPDLELHYSNVSDDGEDGTILLKTGDGRELGRIYYKDIEEITTTSPEGAICFAAGSLIATMRGEVPVEQLREGDRVITRDNGMQELRWIGRRDLSPKELATMPHLQPVLVRAGALGHGLPHTDLVVSPQHRMLIRSDRASLLYEESEVLVAAKDLVGMPGVERLTNRKVTYLHLLFDQHEVILANGAWSESFQPGDYSMKTLDRAQRAEIHYLFPELAAPRALTGFSAARRSLKKHEAEVLRAEGGIVSRPAGGAILPMPRAHRGR